MVLRRRLGPCQRQSCAAKPAFVCGYRRPTMPHRWTNDDDLLAIDLYLRYGTLRPDSTEVRTLVRLFGDDVTAESIVMALGNIEYLATGRGLSNPSQHMTSMWEKWGHRPTEVKVEAEAIRRRREERVSGDRPALSAEAEARIAARMAERRRGRESR